MFVVVTVIARPEGQKASLRHCFPIQKQAVFLSIDKNCVPCGERTHFLHVQAV